MLELLHHFGFIDNRVQIGISDGAKITGSHGVVSGTSKDGLFREKKYFTVDRPKCLARPNNSMVKHMVDQLDKLGLWVNVLEIHSDDSVYTYRVQSNSQVRFLTKSPRFAH